MATKINTITINSVPAIENNSSFTPATCTTADTAEVFTAKVDAADGRWFIEVYNLENGDDITVSLLAGDFIGAKNSVEKTVGSGETALIYADSASCKNRDGMIQVMVTPASGKSLKGGAVKLHAVQFIPAECK